MSLPARGAWIEITIFGNNCGNACRRSPHGERGLKCYNAIVYGLHGFVAPRTGSVD